MEYLELLLDVFENGEALADLLHAYHLVAVLVHHLHSDLDQLQQNGLCRVFDVTVLLVAEVGFLPFALAVLVDQVPNSLKETVSQNSIRFSTIKNSTCCRFDAMTRAQSSMV